MSANPYISDEELLAITNRCSRATAGPWRAFIEGRDHTGGDSIIRTADNDIFIGGVSEADADFIAHARQDVLRLLQEIERLKKLKLP